MKTLKKFGIVYYAGSPVVVTSARKIEERDGIEIYSAEVMFMRSGWSNCTFSFKDRWGPDDDTYFIGSRVWVHGEPEFKRVKLASFAPSEGKRITYAHAKHVNRAVGAVKRTMKKRMIEMMGV